MAKSIVRAEYLSREAMPLHLQVALLKNGACVHGGDSSGLLGAD